MLDLLDRVTVEKPGGDRQSEEAKTIRYNITNGSESDEPARGTSRQYALRRLRKDHPDLHEQVISKDLSAHAAMKQAGFIRECTPLDALRRAWGKASDEERKRKISVTTLH